MDWSKYQLEKLFGVATGVIPGFVALLISPKFLPWFHALAFLGYRTKIALVVVAAFVVGFTMNTFLSSLLGAVGGAIGYAGYKPPSSFVVAPWRDPRWRALLKKKLGESSPNDTLPLSQPMLDLRNTMIGNMPKSDQDAENFKLHVEKFQLDSDDLAWMRWYDHYHHLILLPTRDVIWHVHTGLSFSLQTASLCVVISAIVLPTVRHWWYLVPAFGWMAILVATNYVEVQRAMNTWSTLDDQIKYLSSNA